MKEIKMLRNTGQNEGNELVGNTGNKINTEDLMRLLKRLFPTKTEHSFSKLTKVSSFILVYTLIRALAINMIPSYLRR